MNLKTLVRSSLMRYFSSPAYLEKQRARARRLRDKQGSSPVVHYFHQVDDPYSHLAVQKLEPLAERYAVDFQPHLVSMPEASYQGSAPHFQRWALSDARSVAGDYQTEFSPSIESPAADEIQKANQILATKLTLPDFVPAAVETGSALWGGQPLPDSDSDAPGTNALQQGNALRQQLGHYQGAMFYFDGEWFWGIDRIRLLEARLHAEGFDQQNGPPCVPEPTPLSVADKDLNGIVLEYFPSLRSPYTAIGHQRVLDLIHNSGVAVRVRPVMPMMMRGIPAPRAKQRYIITDAAREGRVHGAPLGKIVDPFGEPVKRAFALFPAADVQSSGMDYVTAYLKAAWFDGVDITREQGLQHVVAAAGLDWQQLQTGAGDHDWQAQLNDNLATLTEADLWGVPSFRVTGGNQQSAFACWGQDRIWRVANEIARRA